ncbi:hypothetical protein PFICI_06088 [Pestalotiopsis fici W106-1]|uniref:Glucose-methanol-choline oxidoreductase N-terminal domain-containing protein n=1 Tax=Pestalotiopsis fici (strain W106-1 / CGMCC3.15140) TaxID=1229662 RepID=W3X7D8_PESFW|nr:uncharacterized protein PFICI_06088 [Pestalotiopsis fici W106-1]ETS81086.1 hypothetical protein PFICI_06088 [Pestalotiopsis fici W106-1]
MSELHEQFDYVVVGGGTAGLVIASRLSEDPEVSVLVLEAGPDNSSDPFVLTPGLVAAQYGQEKYDWNFSSEPQPNLNNRRINQARGRQLGGSSALNFNMLLYPSQANIDAWEKLGNAGWSYNDLLPYFKKFSTTHVPPASALENSDMERYHDNSLNGNGPLHVSYGEGFTKAFNGAWMDTFSTLGLQNKADPRTGKALGAFQNPSTIDPSTKTRSFAATAYLTPDVRQRSNLTIRCSTVVDKILLEQRGDTVAATGVAISVDGKTQHIGARSEVILAAGALQSPQILELSGIGDASLLKKHGIPVVIDSPNVGENLQDHAIVVQSFEVADGVPSGDVLRDPAVLNALIQLYSTSGGEGPLGQSTISVAYSPWSNGAGPLSAESKKALLDAHLPASDPRTTDSALAVRAIIENPSEPAVEYLLFPSQVTINQEPVNMAEIITPSRPENYITVMTMLNHPFSRGSVHITSADVHTKPSWDPKYMSHPLDMQVLAQNVEFVERIVSTEPFSAILKQGGKRAPETVATDFEKAKEIVRSNQISVFHVSGSCSMLPREQGGVVDGRLRVYGTSNLRIVDASVFPLEPLGNIQATVYAVAEKAADFIKEDRKSATV